ncbi:hypothetical protein GCM10020001_021480 [Nonomuraea salmonea]
MRRGSGVPGPLVTPPVPAGRTSHASSWPPREARPYGAARRTGSQTPARITGRVFGDPPEPARDTLPGACPVPSRPSSERRLSPSAAQRAGDPVFPGVM